MKISKSKQELARIISENGGWREGCDFAVQDKDSWVCLYEGRPTRCGDAWKDKGDCQYRFGFTQDNTLPNWHQTILSSAEFFHLYPAPDADGWIAWKGGECPVAGDDHVDFVGNNYYGSDQAAGGLDWSNITQYRLLQHVPVGPEFCESVMRSIPEPETKPTLEQLVADYRNAKYFAGQLQQCADEAKADAKAKLAELIDAGEELGLRVSPIAAKKDPELVITDWRDLRVGDIVWVDAYDGHDEAEWPVSQMEGASYDCDYAFSVKNGASSHRWISVRKPWRFIRRP